MSSVVLLNPAGGEVSVTTRRSFVQLVYGNGYKPKTGSINSNYRALAGGAAPSIDELGPVLLTDLDDPTAEAMKRLAAAYGGQTRVTVDGVYVPTLDMDSSSPTMPSCAVKTIGATQTLGHEDWVAIDFNTVDHNDDPAIYSITRGVAPLLNGTTYFVTVQEPGLYLVEWHVTYQQGGAGQRAASLMRNGWALNDAGATVPAGGWIVASHSMPYPLDVGDVIAVAGYVEVGAGGERTAVQGGDIGFETGFSLTRLAA